MCRKSIPCKTRLIRVSSIYMSSESMLTIKKVNQKQSKTTERNDKFTEFNKIYVRSWSPQCTLKQIPLPHNNHSIYSFRRRHDSTSWPWCEFEVEAVWGNEMDETSEQMEKVISINHSVSRIFAIKSEIFLTFFYL